MERNMLPSSVVAQGSLECGPIAPDKLVATVQDHLRRVRTLRGEAGRINTLPFGKRWRGVRIFPPRDRSNTSHAR